MSWDTALPIMVRTAIGDTASPPKYSDTSLSPVILTAAQSLLFTLPGTSAYRVDVENEILTPDPTATSTLDNTFIYLVTLKSASMLLYAEVRTYGQQAIAIRDGTSAIDLKRDLKALTELAESYNKQLLAGILYAKQNINIGSGRMVVSPYQGLINGIDRYFDCSRIYRWPI